MYPFKIMIHGGHHDDRLLWSPQWWQPEWPQDVPGQEASDSAASVLLSKLLCSSPIVFQCVPVPLCSSLIVFQSHCATVPMSGNSIVFQGQGHTQDWYMIELVHIGTEGGSLCPTQLPLRPSTSPRKSHTTGLVSKYCPSIYQHIIYCVWYLYLYFSMILQHNWWENKQTKSNNKQIFKQAFAVQ